MVQKRLSAIGACLLPLVIAPTLRAQESSTERMDRLEQQGDLEDPGFEFLYTGSVRHVLGAGFDATSGDVSLTSIENGVRVGRQLGHGVEVGLRPYHQYDLYNFSGPTPFGSRAPWDDIQVRGLQADITAPLDNTWTVFGRIGMEWASESDAILSENSWRGTTLIGYRWDENLTLFAGVFHLNGIEQSFTIPLFGFRWNFAEQLGLSSDEGGVNLQYRPSKDLTFALGFNGDAYQARLGPNAAVPNGILQALEVDIGAQARWRPVEDTELRFSIMTNAFHDLELQNSLGQTLVTDRLDLALVLYFEVRVSF